jgi:hypothetical protein
MSERTGTVGDFDEHLKTYKGFLNLLAFSAAGSVAILVILLFTTR